MKAIETTYNGYKFRSRLEARWAVFFDVLGIEYQYEAEGFDLGNGIWYLPDFVVSHPVFFPMDTFIEIKPTEPAASEIEKADILRTSSNLDVIILYGPIDPEKGKSIAFGWKGCNCPDCESRIHLSTTKRGFYFEEQRFFPGALWLKEEGLLTPELHAQIFGINNAITAARSARFEHGEKPISKVAA